MTYKAGDVVKVLDIKTMEVNEHTLNEIQAVFFTEMEAQGEVFKKTIPIEKLTKGLLGDAND